MLFADTHKGSIRVHSNWNRTHIGTRVARGRPSSLVNLLSLAPSQDPHKHRSGLARLLVLLLLEHSLGVYLTQVPVFALPSHHATLASQFVDCRRALGLLCPCVCVLILWSPPRARAHTCSLKPQPNTHNHTCRPSTFVSGDLTRLLPTLRTTRAPERTRTTAPTTTPPTRTFTLDVQPEPRGSTLHRSAALAHPCPCPCPCPPSLCLDTLASQLVEF